MLTSCEEYTNPELTSLHQMFESYNHHVTQNNTQSIRLMIWQNHQDGYVQLHTINLARIPDSDRKPYIRLGWYSPTSINMELCEGQLCGSTGSTQAWRDVSILNLPNISQLLAGMSITWHRSYIVMPDYRWINQNLITESESSPHPKHLEQSHINKLRWFKTHIINNPDRIPDTLFGIDPKSQEVLYSDTCLSATYCFSWQTWASLMAWGHS